MFICFYIYECTFTYIMITYICIHTHVYMYIINLVVWGSGSVGRVMADLHVLDTGRNLSFVLDINVNMYAFICTNIQPIPLGVTFSNAVSKLKAQSSNVSFH